MIACCSGATWVRSPFRCKSIIELCIFVNENLIQKSMKHVLESILGVESEHCAMIVIICQLL